MESVEHLRPYSVPCFDYMDKNGNYKRVSAIIVPISFERKNGKVLISWACSKALTCCNSECRYSKAESS